MASLNLRPLGDRVVVKPLAREEVTSSGIVLPDTAAETVHRQRRHDRRRRPFSLSVWPARQPRARRRAVATVGLAGGEGGGAPSARSAVPNLPHKPASLSGFLPVLALPACGC